MKFPFSSFFIVLIKVHLVQLCLLKCWKFP